ncbi:CLUMA_CG013045, isoform A [Clunio marinus]|uniref:CLUMA_CG013045, isoform A n=1 Tax=Clunio marinus TaxID=568069 RepID=A0A1J1IJH5_9DIPT|nr:CLUMA_CG013045, isoform A [Clunio marinus]
MPEKQTSKRLNETRKCLKSPQFAFFVTQNMRGKQCNYLFSLAQLMTNVVKNACNFVATYSIHEMCILFEDRTRIPLTRLGLHEHLNHRGDRKEMIEDAHLHLNKF